MSLTFPTQAPTFFTGLSGGRRIATSPLYAVHVLHERINFLNSWYNTFV
jgi:hypothetical protein